MYEEKLLIKKADKQTNSINKKKSFAAVCASTRHDEILYFCQ